MSRKNVKNPLLAVMKEKVLVRGKMKGVVELVWIQGKVRSKICLPRTKQGQEYVLSEEEVMERCEERIRSLDQAGKCGVCVVDVTQDFRAGRKSR